MPKPGEAKTRVDCQDLHRGGCQKPAGQGLTSAATRRYPSFHQRSPACIRPPRTNESGVMLGDKKNTTVLILLDSNARFTLRGARP
jgi:hypothetical protein